MASFLTRRTARQFLSLAKCPSPSPSYSSTSPIPISCRYQSTNAAAGAIPSTASTIAPPSSSIPRASPASPSSSIPRASPASPSSSVPRTSPASPTSTLPRAASATGTATATATAPKPAAYNKPFGGSYSSSSPQNNAPIAGDAFKDGLKDAPSTDLPEEGAIDWARSFSGLSVQAFAKDITDILMAPLELSEIECKPDGIIYLPEIKYRRILNRAFGPGGWGLAPRSDTIVTNTSVTREYALVCQGRLVAVARGEQDYFDPVGIPTATEGCKSNALMRCCKDLGIASELWDPRFIRRFKKEMCMEVMAVHSGTGRKKKVWMRKGDSLEYPFTKA